MINREDDLVPLPQGWVWTHLSNISEIILGQSPPSSTYNEIRNGFPFYQGKLEFGKFYPTPRKWCSAPKKVAEKDDVLISVRAPVGPTNVCPERSCIGRGLAAIRGLGGIESHYILYLLRAFENVIVGKGTGTTFNAITGDQLKQLRIPLAPLSEQHRIVVRVEELFSRLDAGVESLRKVKAQLKRYRQAVLKYAFEGKLTEEHHNKFVCDEKLGWVIPVDWDIKPAKELFYIKGRIGWRGLKKSHFTNSGPYLITGVDFFDGKIDWEKCYHIPMNKYLESPEIFVQRDDILLTKDGTIGKIAYIDHVPDGQASINAHILLIRNQQNIGIFAKFIYYLLQTQYFFNFVDLRKIGTTRPALTQRAFEEFPVFYPSLEKQKKIVEKIEDCFSIIDHVNKTLELNLTQARELRQSILDKAFRGELVPHDPYDEPAEQLLERIRVERAKSQVEKDINKKKIKPKQLELSSYVK